MARLPISPSDREQLLQWAGDHEVSPRLQTRARVVLALASGTSDREVSRELGVARQTVALWRRRVSASGQVGVILADAPGRGRKPSVPAIVRDSICQAWLAGRACGAPRSVRDLARQFGLSAATVHRTLKAGVRSWGSDPRAGGAAGRAEGPSSLADQVSPIVD